MTTNAVNPTTDSTTYTLVANWSHGGTISISYPAGRSAADYGGGTEHMVFSNQLNPLKAKNGSATFTFNASTIVITNLSGQTMTLGTALNIQLDRAGVDESGDPAAASNMAECRIFKINLGAPLASSANAAVLSQACSATTGLATGINGAEAAAGVATFATPRAIVAAWTTTAVLTVTGTDVYGKVMVESSASGTSMAGLKAFKTITGIACSANITGLTVGTGKVLGLPMFLSSVVDVLKEYQDGVAPTAGTIVAGSQATPTATTGDVRGTYAPNAAPDGTKVFELLVAVKSAGYKGLTPYAG